MNAPERQPSFDDAVDHALQDRQLAEAMRNIKTHLVEGRTQATAAVDDFEGLRDAAAAIKNHSLDHLDLYIEKFEAATTAAGGHVHFAENAAEACQIILDIVRAEGATRVSKSKSMVTEEIDLNAHLEANGIRPVETDLGEYIIQLRQERPSHIIAPAVHLKAAQVTESFRAAHKDLPDERVIDSPEDLLAEARTVLRDQFLGTEVTVTGANLLIAETGSAVIVTNEGNADLAQNLGTTQIVLAGIEKLVPRLEDAATILRVLPRSATGQTATSYTTVATGPRREGDLDGPKAFHVVLLDNGRSTMLAGAYREMLRCIRCGACMNHCPVYGAIGGHAYGWVYVGPMGSVLTPNLIGLDKAPDLPHASTFCGACEAVCPVKIPLNTLMRRLREEDFASGRPEAARARLALRLWGGLACRPWLYRLATGSGLKFLRLLSRGKNIKHLPLGKSWTRHRDFPPPPSGGSFQDRWRRRKQGLRAKP